MKRAVPRAMGAALAVSMILLGSARPSRAQASVADVGLGVEAIGLVLLAPPLVVDGVYVARQVRPSASWPISGFVCAALGVALGLAYALPNQSSVDDNAGTKTALGWALVAEGALNIGFGIWALTLPRLTPDARHPPLARWAVTPLVARRVGGRTGIRRRVVGRGILTSPLASSRPSRARQRRPFGEPRNHCAVVSPPRMTSGVGP